MPGQSALVETTNPEYRQRLRQCLHSPSGQALMIALAEQQRPVSAAQIAAQAMISTTAARNAAYRASKLGYARQTTITCNNSPAMAWTITPAGRDFLAELLGDTA